MAFSFGLNVYGESTASEQITLPSTLYPEHYFKIGYFRSSYNDSGMDHIMHDLGLPTLSELFDTNGRYEFTPDWSVSLERVNKAINDYSNVLASPTGNLRIMTVQQNVFGPTGYEPKSAAAALEIMRQEYAESKGKEWGDGYSNNKGTFLLKDGIQVVGLMPGTDKTFRGKTPCTYVAYKASDSRWYLEALEIVRETIEYVLKSNDPSKFYFHWSS